MSKKPVPNIKQAVSRTRTRWRAYMRRQRTRLTNEIQLDTCPETGEVKRRHFCSPSGWYRGRRVFVAKSDKIAAPTQEIQA